VQVAAGVGEHVAIVADQPGVNRGAAPGVVDVQRRAAGHAYWAARRAKEGR